VKWKPYEKHPTQLATLFYYDGPQSLKPRRCHWRVIMGRRELELQDDKIASCGGVCRARAMAANFSCRHT